MNARGILWTSVLLVGLGWAAPARYARAHCDTMDGPVVKTAQAVEGIRRRFALAAEKRKHAEESVEAGREFVQAYVEYVHYVERLHADATSPAAHEPAAGEPAAPVTHQH